MRKHSQTRERGWNLEDWEVECTSENILPMELKKDEPQKDTRQGLYQKDSMQRRQQNNVMRKTSKIQKDCWKSKMIIHSQ